MQPKSDFSARCLDLRNFEKASTFSFYNTHPATEWFYRNSKIVVNQTASPLEGLKRTRKQDTY